jgi:hypothetical protein
MITQLLTYLGLAQQPAQVDDTLDRFMQGESIPKLSSSSAHIITRQREIEAEIRWHILGLEAQIRQLLESQDSTRD